MIRRIGLLLALLLPVLAQAHWTARQDLPDWAQRGRLRWCLHYSRANRDLVDLFLQADQTLLHGGSFDSAETAEYARQQGLRYMPYVCSRTVTTTEIANSPQLAGAVVLKADGSEFLAYNNPVRRYGSLYQPAWPEFVRERTRRVWDWPDVAAIFYDNAFAAIDDHNPATIAAWQQWARDRGIEPGEAQPSVSTGPLAAASRLFTAESLTDYHRMLQQFDRTHQPPLLNCPNLGSAAGGMLAVEAGAVDLVFYETMSHPPFENNMLRYKVGLAASHGRPTGILAYLPERVGSERGQRTWHEGMHHYFFPSSPIAEEFALAAAEGAACNGIYIPCYNLFPSLPITDMTDPFNQRIYAELKRSYSFLKANEDLYAASEPAGDVALLNSTLTQMHNRRAQNSAALSEALLAAGIPYEVVVASDLAEDGLGPARTLLAPNVTYLDEPTAAGLLRFVEQGGRAIITGEYGTTDPAGRPLDAPSVRTVQAAMRLFARPIGQWELNGMEPEGADQICVTAGEGTAALQFDGEPGEYVAFISLTDENDGTSTFSFSVAGETVYEGKLDIEDNQQHLFETPGFSARRGDQLQLRVQANAGERGRVQSVLLVGAAAAGGAPLGKGTVMYKPLGLETLSPDELVNLIQPRVRLLDPGKVCINRMQAHNGTLQECHLVNYDFRYEVNRPGRYLSDDDTAEARTFFGANTTVLRKRIHIPDPAQVVDPMLQIRGMATADTTADLVVSINGQPAARIPAQQVRGTWTETPLDPELLQVDNLLEFRVDGEVNGQSKWIQVSIDTGTHEGNSEFSTDGGKTFSGADLSPDLREQTGEYMIRIVDQNPGGERKSADNLVQNAGFEQVVIPHSETKLTVAAARDVQVQVPGALRAALVISPEQKPRWITGRPTGDDTVYSVPRVDIYSVLLLGASREALQAAYDTQMRFAGWELDPVTAPPREIVTGWNAWSDGFVVDDTVNHSGGRSIRCENTAATDLRGAVQTFDFTSTQKMNYTITAWSRAEDVSGVAHPDYSVYVDATCTDGTVYNGHATPFATGTHDWQQVALQLTPPAPLRSMRLHLLFRKKTGRVWFDDVRTQATPAP